MAEVILVSAAVAVLILAAAVLAKNGKNGAAGVCEKKEEFETEYDELTALYHNGRISEEEYSSRKKQLIN